AETAGIARQKHKPTMCIRVMGSECARTPPCGRRPLRRGSAPEVTAREKSHDRPRWNGEARRVLSCVRESALSGQRAGHLGEGAWTTLLPALADEIDRAGRTEREGFALRLVCVSHLCADRVAKPASGHVCRSEEQHHVMRTNRDPIPIR